MNVDPNGYSILCAIFIGFVIGAIISHGKDYTNGYDYRTEQYYTTVKWYGIEINTFYYDIRSNGNVQFSYIQNKNFSVMFWWFTDTLAESIYSHAYQWDLKGAQKEEYNLNLSLHGLFNFQRWKRFLESC